MKFEKAGAGLPEFERLFIRVFLVPIVRIITPPKNKLNNQAA
jgi:hypothetical protein